MHAGHHQPGIEQQHEQCTPCHLSLLPIDMLGQLFERIPATCIEAARKDPNRLSVRAACRWLRDAFDSCNTHLVLEGAAAAGMRESAQRRSYPELLQRLIARTSSLSSLSIESWENGRVLLKLPVPWGRLKKLNLVRLHCQDRYSASGQAKCHAFGPLAHCSGLEELVAFGGCLSMSKPDTLPFRSTLRSLRLLDPSNGNLGSTVPLFTALQQLEIETWGLDPQEDKHDLANVATCTGLRQLSLHLDAFKDVNDSMSSLTSLTQLTSLLLSNCNSLQNLLPIASLSSLRQLELQGADSITDISPLGSLRSSLECLIVTGGFFLGSEACLSACTLLRHLNMRDCHADDINHVILNMSVLSACIHLEYLDLSSCPVSGSLEPLLPCTRLHALCLENCWQVTALAPLTSLTYLDLSGCNRLEDLSPLKACVWLGDLDISYCFRFNSLAPLAACKQLQVLQLARCVQVTSLEPVTTCTKLARLNLYGCSEVRSLASLSACRILEQLDIGECNNLVSLGPLVACTLLKKLNLRNLAEPIDLAPLAACPSLRQLDLYQCCSSMDLTPLQSCSHLKKLFLAAPLYLEALRSFSHLKNLSIINNAS